MAEEDRNLFKGMKWIIGVSVFAAIVLLILFMVNQTYDRGLPVDTGIFGTYGDFLGGFLGTIVGIYTVYLLIKTFQNQSKINRDIEATNSSVVTTNQSIVEANRTADAASQRQYYQTELQLFDSKFRSFLDAYLTAIEHYKYDNEEGRIAFEALAKSFSEMNFENNSDYKRSSDSATDEYLAFYAEHQTMMSVHLRMLYLLVSLISKSHLDNGDKVHYAKLVRGQMSNMEMLIVRYNCRSHYGAKMQPYCNEYNLIKHLPLMSLLEFKEYKIKIEEFAEKGEEGKAEKMISGLNSMFITLRKKATELFYDESDLTCEFKTSHSYTITMTCSENRQSFILSVKKDRGVDRRGGKRISPEERALDILSEDQLINIFQDFLYETFFLSNYDTYNNDATVKQIGTPINNDNEYSFKLDVSNTKRLALSYIQMNNRDRDMDNLELA